MTLKMKQGLWSWMLWVCMAASATVQAESDCPQWYEPGNIDDLRMLRTCIEQGFDAGQPVEDRPDPLHHAVRHSESTEVVRILLEAGVTVNTLDEELGTPLHQAAGYNANAAITRMLLEAGAGIHVLNRWQETPLHRAAGYNPNPEVVRVLLDAGADVDARDERQDTPLHQAAGYNRNPGVLRMLLDGGADVHARNIDMQTPLHTAGGGTLVPETIRMLRVAGADIEARDASRWTPLHRAARTTAVPEVIRELVRGGADIEARNDQAETPLHIAAEANWHPGVVEALLDAGANIRVWNDWSVTPYEAARYNAGLENTEVLERLVHWDRRPPGAKVERRQILEKHGTALALMLLVLVLCSGTPDRNTLEKRQKIVLDNVRKDSTRRFLGRVLRIWTFLYCGRDPGVSVLSMLAFFGSAFVFMALCKGYHWPSAEDPPAGVALWILLQTMGYGIALIVLMMICSFMRDEWRRLSGDEASGEERENLAECPKEAPALERPSGS